MMIVDRSNRVLVTGANGFIGSALCDGLISKHYRVSTAVRRNVTINKQGIHTYVVGDINSNTSWQDVLKDVCVVVHLAARVHVMNENASDPLAEFRAVNVFGTKNLVLQAAESGVKRFIYLSSIKVNGEQTQDGGCFNADDELSPIDPYGVSKLEAEQELFSVAKDTGMEVVIIRPPLVYGPGVKANFLSMMHWLNKGIPLPFGAINNKRSLVALDNLVDLIIRCIKHPAAANEVFLVSDGEDLSTTDLLKRMAQALNKPARLLPVPVGALNCIATILGKRDIATRLLGSLQVDIEKTKTLLNWKPPVSIDDALKQTADDFLRNK